MIFTSAMGTTSAHDNTEGLPEGWAVTTLRDACEINPPKASKDSLPANALVTFVPMPAVDADEGAITTPQTRKFSEVRKGFTSFRDRDVIMAKITPCMENGKAAIAKNLTNGIGFGSTEFHVLRCTEAVLPEFVYHFIRQESYRKVAEDEMTGSVGQKRVPQWFLEATALPLPPLSEQIRIVTKLTELWTALKVSKEYLSRVPLILKRFRQAVLAAACSGRLTEDWRTKNQSDTGAELIPRLLEQRQQLWVQRSGTKTYRHPVKPIVGEEFDRIPDDWSWGSADQCTLWITDGEHITPTRTDFGVYLLSARNVLDGKLSLDNVDYVSEKTYAELCQRLTVDEGDVLLSCSGSVGRSCVAPPNLRFALVRSVAVLKPLFEMGPYLSLALRSPLLQHQINDKKTQTAQSNIFQGKIRSLVFPIPPLKEQSEILRRVNALFHLADEIEARLISATLRTDKLTQSILAKAFRGELVPTEAELARREGREYEPASVLLERIKKEREQEPSNQPKRRGTHGKAKLATAKG